MTVKPHLYSNSGNVLMVQVENEYGSYGNTGGSPADLAYMEHLRDFAYANLGGPDAIQLYTTDGLVPHLTLLTLSTPLIPPLAAAPPPPVVPLASTPPSLSTFL